MSLGRRDWPAAGSDVTLRHVRATVSCTASALVFAALLLAHTPSPATRTERWLTANVRRQAALARVAVADCHTVLRRIEDLCAIESSQLCRRNNQCVGERGRYSEDEVYSPCQQHRGCPFVRAGLLAQSARIRTYPFVPAFRRGPFAWQRSLQRSLPELRSRGETFGRSADRFLDDSGGHFNRPNRLQYHRRIVCL